MALTKVTYTDNVTVIGATNLNAIQDEIIANAAAIADKSDKSTTVSTVGYDTANKKLTKTINGTTSDVVSVATLKTDMQLSKSDVGLGNVDNTSDANKPISTATQTALDAKADADDLTFVTPEMYGAYGDGTHDDTVAIQSAFNSSAKEIRFAPGKTYLVSKATNSTLYPDNDAPCVYIHTKSHKVINGNGATLRVNTHGQGVMEIIASDDIVVRDLGLEGYGATHTPAFPKVQTSGNRIGQGEKGDRGAKAGYYRNAYYDWEAHKNNSYDTSNFKGFGGNDDETWGTFGDGYIGNIGNGLLIENGCKNIRIENCRASGFNYAGFMIGSHGHSNYAMNEHIVFDGCYAHNCYDSGFSLVMANEVDVQNCLTEDIGHPNVRPVDENTIPLVSGTNTPYNTFDPGYGIACHGTTNQRTDNHNIRITNSVFRRCVRKGIDSHTVDGYTLIGNHVSLCYYAGIDMAGNEYLYRQNYNVLISNNTLEYCGLKGNALNYYIYTGTPSSGNEDFDPNGFDANAVISGNILRNCACSSFGMLNVRTGRNVKVIDNIISEVWGLADMSALNGIYIGQGDCMSEGILISGNSVSIRNATIAYPIRIRNLKNGSANHNIINVNQCVACMWIDNDSPKISDVNVIGNSAIAGTYTSGYVFGSNTGSVLGNSLNGDATDSFKTFSINVSPVTSGAYRFENSFIKSTSRVIVTPQYSGVGVTQFLTTQTGDGFVTIYARYIDGNNTVQTTTERLKCSIAVFN